MEFKRIQHRKTLNIITRFVDGKAVTKKEYDEKELSCMLMGMKYNSSSTTTNKARNYVHIANYN